MKDSEIIMKFSPRLKKILKELVDAGNYVAFELSYMSEPTAKYINILEITDIDVGTDYNFLVTIDGKARNIKIGSFLREYFTGIFRGDEITKFSNAYNKIKNGKKLNTTFVGDKITVGEFKYNPKDPRSTFLSLTTKTYPHGHEEEVLQFLPELTKDKFGNYYKIVGNNKQPSVMFTSHLDTADRIQAETNLYSYTEEGNEMIYTDGTTILGADDKSGVTVMLYMMAHDVPGLYYFFIGEERGGIGSNMVADNYYDIDYVKNIKKCISFDRRKTTSVITSQFGRVCCSNQFGTALCQEYNKSGFSFSLDPTGIFTDSASFMDDIAECTNVSVGYENEHTGRELQNMTFLIKLCEASVKVDWEGLPVARRIGIDPEILSKYKTFLADIKSTAFDLEVKLTGYEDYVYIRIDLDNSSIGSCYDTLSIMSYLLKKNKMSDNVIVQDNYIKIQLN